jgi:hypothetical protein
MNMSIGGTDIVLLAPADVPIADLVLRICRRFWPNCVFQEANSAAVHKLDEVMLWLRLTGCNEFFIYHDSDAADTWTTHGSTSINLNNMLHFILSEQPRANLVEVTLVCDVLTDELRMLIDSLKSGFQDLLIRGGVTREAA